PWVPAGAALLAAAGFVLLRARSAPVRRALPAFAWAVPLFVATFAMAPGVRGALRQVPQLDVSSVDSDVPVVVVVFDELPLTSLQAADGSLDAALFPHFAALARAGVWYPNATTVSGATLRAVPGILTGRLPAWNQQPGLADHPRNLFTLLADSHRLVVDEVQTNLCPPELARWVPATERRRRLVRDAGIVYLHAVALPAWRDRLPAISTRWSDFGEQPQGDPERLRTARLRAWIDRLTAGDRPPLGFVHALLPHSPYRLTPDGHVYHWRERPGVDQDGRWGDDPAVARDAWRRHLLQLACTDGLLGDVVDQLQAQGLYDRCLLVVTADHGCSFRAGEFNRRASATNLLDIMAVPLLVKYPQGGPQGTDLRHAQLTDILPTIVDVLGAEPGWDFDGRSLRDDSAPDRQVLDFLDQDAREHRRVPVADLARREQSLQAKHAAFGDPQEPWDLLRRGPAGDLVGVPLTGLDVRPGPRRATLNQRQEVLQVDTTGVYLPAELSGTCRVGDRVPGPLLAVAVEGVVAGVGRPRRPEPSGPDRRWRLLVDPGRFRQGANTVELLQVNGEGPSRHLVSLGRWSRSVLGQELGGRALVHVPESGFHAPETWHGTPFRWTDGRATLQVPLEPGERPRRLTCRLVSTGPAGTELTIRVGGTTIVNESLVKGPWQATIRLPDLPPHHGALDLEITSGVFDAGPDDGRTLGVGLAGIVLN
ncbi:MAG: sulfatase-like hydrolase/transferase, partial [Krumholzibacteria bacterium]|nr:sulfatase-like hydrolase/transferase [Candidatus Krumholzibacteria bacterium]